MKTYFLISVTLVLYTFTSIGVRCSVENYNIYRPEPMCTMSLAINSLLNQCLIVMHGGLWRSYPKLLASRQQNEALRRIRKDCSFLIWIGFWKKLAKRQRIRVTCKLLGRQCEAAPDRSFFRKISSSEGLKRLMANRLIKSNAFVGAIADRCCGKRNSSGVTKMFTRYVDILRSLMICDKNLEWNNTEIDTFRAMKEVFGKYHD